jgi:uncharacterized protein (UPF0332 family)
MPHSENRRELSQYRLEQARECLYAAARERDAGDYTSAANRAYYCTFHAMRAILALDGFDSKRHSGIISEFQRSYIKTQIFTSEYSAIIQSAFKIRGQSDYEDFFVVPKSEIEHQIDNAEKFLAAVEDYLRAI